MLDREHDRGGADRLAVDIFQRHLAFGIRLQSGRLGVAGAAKLGDAPQNQMRVEDRRRHQRLGFGAGIAEHDALIARPFILVAGGIDANGDIGGLRMQMHGDLGIAPGKPWLIIADIVHRQARQMRQIILGDGFRAARFPGQNDAVGGHQRLAGHPRIGVGGKVGIHHRIGNPVRDLVRVTFRNRFRREQKLTRVAHQMLP